MAARRRATLPPMDGDHIRLDAALGGLELIEARHRLPRFGRHAHPTYAIGAVAWGVNRFRYRGAWHDAPAGALCTVVPDEVHEVEPFPGGFAYRCLYPQADLIQRAAAAAGLRGRGTVLLPPVIDDPGAAALVHALFEAEAAGAPPLERESRLLALLCHTLGRHARRPRGAPPSPAPRPAVERARAWLLDHLAEPVTLAALAEACGAEPFALLRAFGRAHGLPPHAWLVQARVRRAQRLLREGLAPAEVALACGFSDQSHLNRHFRRLLGVTPGAYRRAAALGRGAPGRAPYDEADV
jgi:AraC-like DNA-binding protein